MTRARSAAGYWLNHVALTTDMRVREKSRPFISSPGIKRGLNRKRRRQRPPREREREREKWPQSVLKPRMKEKNERVKQERRGGWEDDRENEQGWCHSFSSPVRLTWWWRSARGFYSCEPELFPTRTVAGLTDGPDEEGHHGYTDDPEEKTHR